MSKVLHSGMALDDALTSKSAFTRSLARMTASEAAQEVVRMINVEINRPDCPPHMFLQALAEWFIQMHASVAAQVCKPDMAETAANCMVNQTKRVYAEHFERVMLGEGVEVSHDLPH